jgi:hypothetical protein
VESRRVPEFVHRSAAPTGVSASAVDRATIRSSAAPNDETRTRKQTERRSRFANVPDAPRRSQQTDRFPSPPQVIRRSTPPTATVQVERPQRQRPSEPVGRSSHSSFSRSPSSLGSSPPPVRRSSPPRLESPSGVKRSPPVASIPVRSQVPQSREIAVRDPFRFRASESVPLTVPPPVYPGIGEYNPEIRRGPLRFSEV